MTKANSKIPWSDEDNYPNIEEELYYYILQHQAHTAPRNSVTAKWNAVNNDFFNHGESGKRLKDDFYVEGTFRCLRDKFTREKDAAIKEMEKGNKSKYDGDEISLKYKLLKQLIDEEAAADELSKNKNDEIAKGQAKLREIEEQLKGKVNKNDYGKRKAMSGEITDNTDASKKPKGLKSLDIAMMNALEVLTGEGDEGIIEEKMLRWVATKNKSMEDLLLESKIPDAMRGPALDLLEALEFPTLLNLFCEKGAKFTPTGFKKNMHDMGVVPFVYHKIFAQLTAWMNEMKKDCEFITPPTAASSSVSASSSAAGSGASRNLAGALLLTTAADSPPSNDDSVVNLDMI